MLSFLPVLLLNALIACALGSSDYDEKLLLRPLPQDTLLASFNFRSNESAAAFEQQNFRFFPRSLGQILQHARAKELHLRFSVGRWDAENWGQRPWNGAREGGTGVELWAWVEADNEAESFAQWLTLTNALSGLFCASLNFIDATKTIRPVMSFSPEGDHSNSSNLHLLHGTLPHEVVCTENLTPFLKLLPCKGKAGISSLLDGHKLFDASFQTMAIDVRPVCEEGGASCSVEMEQTVDMVLDIARSKRPRDNPIPRPLPIEQIECDTSKGYNAHDTCYPLNKGTEPAWTLEEVFGRPLKGGCPLVDDVGDDANTVCINTPPERTLQVNTTEQYFETRLVYDTLRCYKLPTGADFDLVLPEQQMKTGLIRAEPPLFAARSINGHGQERGSTQAIIRNPSTTEAVEIVYLESLPWFMKPYLHTLRARIDTTPESPIKETYYRPAVDRQRGTHLELRLVIPPSSTLTLTYDFEKAILRYTEYPPDANRGFDVAPAVIRLLSPPPGDRKGIYVRTTSLLLPLPTPDFSMPYNVIILTSTVMALGFGNIFNLLVRRFVGVDEVPIGAGGLKGVLQGKLMRLKTVFGKT
ncbi:GPI transamidase component GPI16 precursor [Dothidotthia symphoricarpi CBS 119687]|uniref:GPI transamidase component GPI16 n=1 Tax=Dothidotthia symphoricarpi CBS 119687 TaxID=1392245 RepID=A0A6A6A029_9PLEO|nr:GPI transamidase component GPI16 precursor [Dothidotthia symphoricarpi CBS 119687]KAF2123941.1 GPI transamidase component GPI16 precursor [Dothidotthia symphoricarpi CBS 119687]